MARHTGIRKLPNGRFRARYFRGYDSKTGKRVYPAKTFDTEREAREWRSAETSARGSSIVEGRGVTLETFLDHWLRTRLDLRENSRSAYQRNVDTYIKPGLGHIKLSRLTPTHIEDWQVDLLEKVSPNTVSHVRAVLHGALEAAGKKDLIRSNAVAKTKGPKTKKTRRYALTIEEALTILEGCDTAQHGLAYQVMARCGLRPSEALGLQWGDLDLSLNARGTLRVGRGIHHVKGELKVYEPKTPSGERSIKFPRELSVRLTEHRKSQLEQKLRMGQLWKDNDFVFTNDIGEPLKGAALEFQFNKLIKRLGLPRGITMYALRHFFVTSSLMAGVDVKTLSREAGHATVAFTLQRYGHVLEEMHEAAASKREELLTRRSGK